MKIVIYLPNLFFRAKVETIINKIPNIEMHNISSLDNLGTFDYLIVNAEDVVPDILEKYPGKVLSFCPHTNTELVNKPGVYPKSIFFKKLPELIK